MMYAYNPRKKSFQELEQSMVGSDRWHILNNILAEMDINKKEGPKQHWIIIGPRGIGKSHLLTLLYHKVKNDKKLEQQWLPILFPEELKMVNNLSKFLERTIQEILYEYPQKDNKKYQELVQGAEKVKTLPVNERCDLYFSLISHFCKETGRHILLLLENLQHLLGKKFPLIDRKKLRAFLQTDNAFLIIGSATTVFDELHDHSQPFYHFFHVRRLEDLEFSEMKNLITNILFEREQSCTISEDDFDEARLRALFSFTGGNPRMAIFLANILSAQIPLDMIEIMDGILDELTPYFLSILNDIPDYLEDIINTLAAYEPAQSPNEIAGHLEIPQNTVRNYLMKLKESGYIRLAFSKGKNNYYCLNEYLYRTWYQMRDSSQREENRWLMELLLMLYSREKIIEENKNLPGEISQKEKEIAVLSYLKYLSSYYPGINAANFDLLVFFHGYIEPLLKNLSPQTYLDQFYGLEKGKLNRIELGILLILLNRYHEIAGYSDDILKKGSAEKEKDGNDLGLFIFTLRLHITVKLIQGDINEALAMIDLFIAYLNTLKSFPGRESKLLSFCFYLILIQVRYSVEPLAIKKLLQRLEDVVDVPFSPLINKIWTCLAEPDSVEAQRYFTEKPIQDAVNILKNYTSIKVDQEV